MTGAVSGLETVLTWLLCGVGEEERDFGYFGLCDSEAQVKAQVRGL